MSGSGPLLSRSYALHDVCLEICAAEPKVLAALELRLQGFSETAPPDAPVLRLRFAEGTADPPRAGSGRPVYETPYGTLWYHPDEDLLTGELGGVRLHCEPGAGAALISASDFSGRSLYFATHPVATVALMELMERLGRFSLHAACVSDAAANGLLVCGPSGAGKSTLTLALARSGMEFLGDDVVFLKRREPPGSGVDAIGFADALGIGAFAASRFPELSGQIEEAPAPGFPKRLSRFEELFGRAARSRSVPRVIVFPDVAPDLPSAVAPLERGEALIRLVPDVLITQPASTREHVAAIGELLNQVRCYAVRSGHDLERAAELVRALL